jgi:prolyl oligopeptidase
MRFLPHAKDMYQWLEAPTDATALEWCSAQTEAAQTAIGTMLHHDQIKAQLTDLIAADAPPRFALLGSTVLKFLRSAANPHGILKVTKRDSHGLLGSWRTVLDIGALRKQENKPYELQFGMERQLCLPPFYCRCILMFSLDGDEHVELREFDLDRGAFVADGYRTPASRAMAAWLDIDHLLIQHTLNNEPRTASGWASVVYIWMRGTPLLQAKPIFRARQSDAMIAVSAMGSGANRIGLITRAVDIGTFEVLLVQRDGSVKATTLPVKIKGAFSTITTDRHIVAQLAQKTIIAARSVPAETLIAYDTARELPEDRRISVVYTPDTDEFISDGYFGSAGGRSKLHAVVDRHGAKCIVSIAFTGRGWKSEKHALEAPGVNPSFPAADPASNDLIVARSGFLLPTWFQLQQARAAPVTLFSEKSAFDESAFTVALKSAASKDGTSIDYYLIMPKRRRRDGETPTLITGYGGFGLSVQPGYLAPYFGGRSLAIWFQRGGALAVPMIRGGGERGEAWYQAAIREKRQNSFDDFEAVAEALIKDRFTKRDRLGVFGSSNGGLLALVVGIQRPDLFSAIASNVPLTDMLRFPLMGIGGAWIGEFGDPNDPAMHETLYRYSPYHNVSPGRHYPRFLITTSTADDRAGPGHARKLAALLKDAGYSVYFLEYTEGGHGVSDPLNRPDLLIDQLTFFVDTLM